MLMMAMAMMMMMSLMMMMMSMGVGRYFGNAENATLQLSLEMLGIPKTQFFDFEHIFYPIPSMDGRHDAVYEA